MNAFLTHELMTGNDPPASYTVGGSIVGVAARDFLVNHSLKSFTKSISSFDNWDLFPLGKKLFFQNKSQQLFMIFQSFVDREHSFFSWHRYP